MSTSNLIAPAPRMLVRVLFALSLAACSGGSGAAGDASLAPDARAALDKPSNTGGSGGGTVDGAATDDGSNRGGQGGMPEQSVERLDAASGLGGMPAMDAAADAPPVTPARPDAAADEGDVPGEATCSPPPLKLTRITTADAPMALAQAPGDARMFVAQRAGLVRVFRGGAFEAVAFANLQPSVLTTTTENGTHERGLLNFVLHPQFDRNGKFYVFYTRRANDPQSQGALGAVVIAEGQQDPETRRAQPALRVLATVTMPDDHNLGGFLAFGPGGLLYAGIGDGGGGIDRSGAGQEPKGRLAKILRIDVDAPQMKPAGNLGQAGADPLTWAHGVRNPFRGSFDSLTGDLYFGDVGDLSWEEINFVAPGASPENFGWGFNPAKQEDGQQLQSGMEGRHPVPFYTSKPWAPFGYLPIHEYPHDGAGWEAAAGSWMKQGFACLRYVESTCSRAVIGGVVYRGRGIKGLAGRYIFGDYVQGTIMSFLVKDGAASCHADLTSMLTTETRIKMLSGFGVDAKGEVYLMTLADGDIFRIDPR